MSKLSESLYSKMAVRGLTPRKEFFFHPERQWRFDFAFLDEKLAIEVQGGIFSGGGHVRGDYFQKECEKLNAAVVLGWTVLRFTPKHIKEGYALQTIWTVLRRLRKEQRIKSDEIPS